MINLQLQAQEIKTEAPFVPLSAEVLAQGGAFISRAQGFQALFYNPAAFATEEETYTAPFISGWCYSDPEVLKEVLGQTVSRGGGIPGMGDRFAEHLSDSGLGVGTALGMGYVGKHIGLGGLLVLDSYLYGQNETEYQGHITASLGLVGGYAYPIDMGNATLTVGGTVKILLRVNSLIDPALSPDVCKGLFWSEDLFSVLNNYPAVYGFGIGGDIGLLLEVGSFNCALVLRDVLATRFFYREDTVGDIQGSVVSGHGLPQGSLVEDTYQIPMQVDIGVAFHPDLGALSEYIDPLIQLECSDIISVIEHKKSFLTLFRLGAEVVVCKTIALRGGINQGHLSYGAGLQLGFFEFNLALFAFELGQDVGEEPMAGLAFDILFNF
ncbi:MAG: hypothetical protein JW822_09620 [Spirochaetales bacterium]|nr:hypothetical protein [Spirochaetales bacterium]